MEVGLIHKIDIDDEMQQSYLDYAMSVIVARALPDARDGLKPVHRRILYSMNQLGLRPDSPYKKSARIVGEVLGKYHPHGDMSVYEAMARMAQDFSVRYKLVDGQGNFGSIDGDPPAAMRYTEARLAVTATLMLSDIEKDTVNFVDNFDGTLNEPTVLPSALPNLLVNGATGIAVGMATSIPPHNLEEIVDAMVYMLKTWEKLDDIGIEDLMKFVKGPDFPTGGIIVQEGEGESLVSAYSTGRGRVTIQARTHLEEMERGRNRIIVSELPYMTNKSSLIERIADLVRDERVEGIVDLRDESDRQGMRIVIELSKTANPEEVLFALHKYTPMQNTFSINMLALVDGEPRLLSLKQALRVYLEHRLEVVHHRSEYDLKKARQRAHILEGLQIALDNLDEVIDLIRRSRNADNARIKLKREYKLSDEQATAILDMPLRRLAALERKRIEDEYKELLSTIKSLTSLLRSPKKMRQTVADELLGVKETYADRRRTHLFKIEEGKEMAAMLTGSALIPEKNTWISVIDGGLISRSLEDKQPRLSGREAPMMLIQANTRDTLYLVAENGIATAIPVHSLPETDTPMEGRSLTRISPFPPDTPMIGMFVLPPRENNDKNGAGLDEWFVLTATRQGMVKKSALVELPGASANPFILVRVNEGDRLGWLNISDGSNDVLLVTANGMGIRFNESDVRPMGLVAAGVMGIKLQPKDEVVGMDLIPQPGDVFMVATDGSAKRVRITDFPRQGRYGQGVVSWKLPPQVNIVGMTINTGTARAALHLKKLLPKPIRLDDAPLQGRAARGKTIQTLKKGDQVINLIVPWKPPRPKPKKRTSRKSSK